MKKYNLAVVGATGLVGQTVLKVLKELGLFKQVDLTLFVSDKSSGKRMMFSGKEYALFSLNSRMTDLHYDFVIFSAGDDVSKLYAHRFYENGAYVIDNSNAFRRESVVPLVVPEINGELIKTNCRFYSNPNCSTIQLVLALNCLKRLAEIKRVFVSSYQSVSGAGSKALDDLFNGTEFEIKEGINSNVIASIGSFEKNGYCVEEDKIMFEAKKILQEDFEICASTVRVPIPYCHLESVVVEFEKEIDFDKVKNVFDGQAVILSDDVVLPTNVAGTNKTYVFRVRRVNENTITFFVLADNLRRGAAFNAIEILQRLLVLLKDK